MTEIKNLTFFDKNKLKSLNSFVESGLDFSIFYPFPVDFFHRFLPFKLKFLNESYVALQDKKVKGLITVNKAETKRVKISRLLLDENSFEYGKLLVNCMVSLCVSGGAESFYVIADKTNTPLITMFIEGCGFKNSAHERVYKIDKKDIILESSDINFEHIRKITFSDTKPVENLINGVILSHALPSFYKKALTLKKKIILNHKQFVLYDKSRNLILGYFTLSKIKKSSYTLEFALAPKFEGYITDLLNYVKSRVIKNPDFETLYIKLKSYYINFNELKELLDFECNYLFTNAILTKDFLAVKKQDFAFEKMIFNDATPAF
ncbi:MAG: hypothetical protein LUE64_05365 [Candidatus Gastranaerophilales bacterium]|nr:hypothetical protein [Candidatus Gastranaerophilales bacterium]